MNFDFTEEQVLFQKSLREAVEKYIVPGYMERAKKDEFNRDALPILKQLGLLGLGVDEKYGGQGTDFPEQGVTKGIINYELGRGDQAFNNIFGANFNAGQTLTWFGTEEQKQEWLPGLCAGEKHIGFCFTEPSTGTDLAALETSGVKDGDDWIINGTKSSVSFAFSDAHFVAVKTDPAAFAKGISLFLIPSNLPGVQISVYSDFGLKQLGRGDVNYNNVRLPARYMIGEGSEGFRKVMHIFDQGRPGLCLTACGAAEVALEKSMEYCRQREVFGRPLAKYEAISFGFAEHFTKLEAAKLLAFKSLWIRDQGRWNTKEAAMSKFFGCEAAFEAVWFAIRVLGHLGYTAEYDACQRLADVMGWAWGDGSWEACKMIVAREIGGREFLPYDRPKRPAVQQ